MSKEIKLFDPEKRKKVKVMFGCPNQGHIRTELVQYLLKHGNEIDTVYLPQKRHNFVNANTVINYFLKKTKCTHLLEMDDDINPFGNTVSRMLNMLDQGFDACCCVVPIYDGNFKKLKFGAGRLLKDGRWQYLKLTGDVEPVDFIGGAYWMATRECLETIGPPWFNVTLKENGSMNEGADLYFSNKIRKAGFKMCADLSEAAGQSVEIELKNFLKPQ